MTVENKETMKPAQQTIGYKEMKNFIHNDLQITREEVQSMIREILRHEVSVVVGENREFIRQSIREIIREEMVYAMNIQEYPRVTGNIWNYTKMDGFRTFVSDILKEEIVNSLRNQFEVNLDIQKKE